MRRVLALTLVVCSSALAAKRVLVKVAVTPKDGTNSIVARVENQTAQPVTFCVEFGQRSVDGNIVESTPIPFEVQAQSDKGWSTLLIGPDVGSARRPVVLDGGKSADFPFRLRHNGKFRLLLRYWNGAAPDLNCKQPPAGSRQAKSSTALAQLVYTRE